MVGMGHLVGMCACLYVLIQDLQRNTFVAEGHELLLVGRIHDIFLLWDMMYAVHERIGSAIVHLTHVVVSIYVAM